MPEDTKPVTMDLNIVSCQTCDAMFIESERRQSCPGCGGPPVGPYFQFVLDGSGLHPKGRAWEPLINREQAIKDLRDLSFTAEEAEARVTKWEEGDLTPAEAAAEEAPAEEEKPAGEGIQLPPSDVLPLAIESFLRGGEATGSDLRTLLLDLGAEPEAAAAAVGRLVAVRELLAELAEHRIEAGVEVEAEVTPAEAPEPEPAPESPPEAA